AALRGADVAVNLHGRGPQSHRLLLDTAPGRLVAFGCSDVSVGDPQWRADEHEVLRWCRLLAESGIPADPAALDIDVPAYGVPPRLRGCTVIHPGAAFRARQWPAERWADVAGAELAGGRTVLVTAAAAEADLVRAVVDAVSAPEPAGAGDGRPVLESLVGADIATFAAHVAAAGRVLCADTGVAHLATALRRPSVVLFGPTPPALWGPPADRREHVVLWKGRTGDPLADEPDRGLLDIGVPEVVSAAAALDQRAGEPSGRPHVRLP
ncbi:MAG TPA: glycosyltransferase family 9 protein, partial [Mycobacteriales bacterium]|nr:glycosyltransferase family 9 protein [Mycobacteriales bacterium]